MDSLAQNEAFSEHPAIENERRILIFGNSGNGKSASANTIIGQRVFESRPSTQSVTKKSQYQIMTDSDKKYLIVDTPALFGTSMDNNSLWELAKTIGITYPGFHVMIAVIEVGRFTEQVKTVFKNLERIFGSIVFDRTMILFTGLDNLEADGMQFRDYVNNHIQSELKQIITNCDKRVVGFNNRADELTRNCQVRELLDKVEAVYERNKYMQPLFYSDRLERFFELEIKRRHSIDNSKRNDELYNEIRREIQNEIENTRDIISFLIEDLKIVRENFKNDKSCLGRFCRAVRRICQRCWRFIKNCWQICCY